MDKKVKHEHKCIREPLGFAVECEAMGYHECACGCIATVADPNDWAVPLSEAEVEFLTLGAYIDPIRYN